MSDIRLNKDNILNKTVIIRIGVTPIGDKYG